MQGTTARETERLQVRTAAVADAELLHRLWTDPRVMTLKHSDVNRVHREDWESGS